jgi:hypothetical protein
VSGLAHSDARPRPTAQAIGVGALGLHLSDYSLFWGVIILPHHETFSTTIQPSYSSTKG